MRFHTHAPVPTHARTGRGAYSYSSASPTRGTSPVHRPFGFLLVGLFVSACLFGLCAVCSTFRAIQIGNASLSIYVNGIAVPEVCASHARTCKQGCTHVPMRARARTHHTLTHARTHTRTRMRTNTHTHTHTSTCARTHTHTHTNTHTHSTSQTITHAPHDTTLTQISHTRARAHTPCTQTYKYTLTRGHAQTRARVRTHTHKHTHRSGQSGFKNPCGSRSAR